MLKRDAAWVFLKVREIIHENLNRNDGWGKDSQLLSTDSDLWEEGMDSLDFLDIVMDCELEFKITIPDAEVQKIKTTDELYTLVQKCVNEQKGELFYVAEQVQPGGSMFHKSREQRFRESMAQKLRANKFPQDDNTELLIRIAIQAAKEAGIL